MVNGDTTQILILHLTKWAMFVIFSMFMYVSSLPFICHLYSFGFSFLHLTDQIIQLLDVKWKVGMRCGDVMQACTLAA